MSLILAETSATTLLNWIEEVGSLSRRHQDHMIFYPEVQDDTNSSIQLMSNLRCALVL